MIGKEKRKLFKLNDIIIIIVLLFVSIVSLYFIRSNNSDYLIAQISYNGDIVKEIDLESATDIVFTLSENKNVSFQILNHKIRFVNTNCPDKLCEKFGYLDKPNDVAICLPNKVSLRIIGKKEDIDIVVN